jgi:uncharacterized protein (DUF4415 family)
VGCFLNAQPTLSHDIRRLATAVEQYEGPKEQITLRIDPDVLKFFRKQGRGYQSTINAVLRKYMEAQERRT